MTSFIPSIIIEAAAATSNILSMKSSTASITN